ncbi:metalloproteinase 8 [Coccidioides immitis RS]|uniref:Neutral protease 2 n=3 Tax=Coccidioides immitis TaxID=5501 RepID=J3K0T6_COCIM|nr:metalloproteinase 8 [Coccidioides immitis RS]EAS27496.3 metalloproteinase 8 [Coccidioides immitis RS]KMP09454.1 neutral protease 2 [Coccidioides immitis RMSCC 2394]KMU75385.1 neutral protease 2 [Coccidioides immitis RMSCC 3703]TPX20267.1 Neutral protease 2 mep8 [Coccidioides immitis]
MKLSSILLALAALVSPAFSYAISHLPRSEGGLDIQLTAIGNTRIKAIITNKADRPLKLLRYNNFFDDAPTQKVEIFKDGNAVQFEGIYQHIYMTDLPDEDFISLTPGESIEREVDIATTADLTQGGAFTISSQGLIPFAEVDSNEVTGAMAFHANDLEMDVDGAVAATVEKAIKPVDKRSRLTNSCTGQRRTATVRAIQASAQLSQRSAQVAQNNAQKLREYFKQTDQRTRQLVVNRFTAVARESTVNGGRTTYDCTDRMGHCQPRTIAYTLPAQNHITNCPIFYQMPLLTNRCHGQDQATTVLHEITHNPAIVQPHCLDHGYGYQAVRRLNAQQSLQNADTYSLFANAVHVGC